MQYGTANSMEKFKTTLYLSVLLALSLSIGIIAYPEVAYGDRGNDKNDDVREREGEEFHQAILKTDDKEYEIDADFVRTEGDFGEISFVKNEDARDVKNLKLSAEEEVEIDFECAEARCEVTDVGDYDEIIVYLVDKNEKDIDIARDDVDEIERIAEEGCFESLENCDLEITIPDDVDNGKYKFVIQAAFDEGATYFINKVNIKE